MADRDNSKETNETTEITGHTLIECITLLCSSSDLPVEDAQMLALDALLPSHHPAIIQINPHLWIKIVKHMKLKPKEFCIQYKNKVKSLLIDHYKVTLVILSCNLFSLLSLSNLIHFSVPKML